MLCGIQLYCEDEFIMRGIRSTVILAAFLCLLLPPIAKSQSAGPAAFTGEVSSQEEGKMEGVLVSAKRAGSNVTITVVSDATGKFTFPGNRLQPGRFTLKVRAAGYDLASPSTIEIAANKTATADLKLVKAKDVAPQLSDAEWIMSFPGTDAQRRSALACTVCHSLEKVARTNYDAAKLAEVSKRMRTYLNGSTPIHPVVTPPGYASTGPEDAPESAATVQKRAQFLASINLSAVSAWNYPFKTLPRPKGDATKVIYTEYDLTRPEAEPHDAAVNIDGMVWYSDFGALYLGRLNPKTGEVKEWRIPEVKQGVATAGTLSISFDKQGNVWAGSLFQGAIYKFDPKTEKFTSWNAPKDYNTVDVRTSMTAPWNSDVDGKVWFGNAMGNRVVHRLTLATGQVETFSPYGENKQGHSIYGVMSDSNNNGYFLDMTGGTVGTIDAKTGAMTLYPTPTPKSRPRRGSLDSQDRVWFGENAANRIGMFDPKTKQIREWAVPTPWTDPYDVMFDKSGFAWTQGMVNDQVVRLNPTTGKMTEYLLPRHTQSRRVFVDNAPTQPAYWVGSNLGASIVKLEPVDY